MPDAARSRLALALLALDGVGRVTAGRLLHHFASYDALRRYPREQVRARIQGAPNADALVERLFDDAMRTRLDAAQEDLDALHEQRVTVIARGDPDWPAGLNDLDRSDRPVTLYAFGDAAVLQRPLIGLFAPLKLTPGPFEQAQALVAHLLAHDLVPLTSAATGFDVVVHKRASAAAQPSALIASCGMARLVPRMRPSVSAAVRSGGLFVSPFPMQHGPFDHDDRERALVQAALATAAVFVEPVEGTPDWAAMTWAQEQGRPVFGIAAPEHPLPASVHPLASATDFDWVVAATQV